MVNKLIVFLGKTLNAISIHLLVVHKQQVPCCDVTKQT